MVKLVDTLVSGTSGRKTVQVRVLFRAHTKKGDGKVVRLVLSPFSFYYLLLSITLHATTPLYCGSEAAASDLYSTAVLIILSRVLSLG